MISYYRLKVPWVEIKKIKPIIDEFRVSECSTHCLILK